MIIRMIKRWLLRRRLIKFFEKNSGVFYHSGVISNPHLEFRRSWDVALERKNLITNYPVMSNSRCVSGLDVIRHRTVVDLDELNKEYNFEEKKLYFSDKTAQL